MSYILDALKKSDRERQQGQVPGLHTLQDNVPPQKKPGNLRLLWLTGIVLAVLIFVITIFRLFPDRPAKAPSPNNPAISAPAPPAAEPAADHPANTSPVDDLRGKKPPMEKNVEPRPSPNTTESAEKPVDQQEIPTLGKTGSPAQPTTSPQPEAAKTTEEKSPPEIIPYEQLPAAIRDGLPTIKISAHYYALSPGSRRASINGLLRREGQKITGQLSVHEITSKGVIFSFEGQLFSMKVFEH